MRAFSFGRALGEKIAAEPNFLQSYGNVLDRWYNPWTKQRNYERGEKGLMRAGQAAMGVGAVAGAAAGGIAAAPTIAGMGTGTAATAGTGGVIASQTPAGQNLMQRLPAMAQNAAHTYSSRVEPALSRIGYGPSDAAHDLYAAGTGNFDRIKGPNWGMVGAKPPSMNTVTGAPSGWTTGLYPALPRPAEVIKNMASSASSPPVLAQAKL